MFIGHIKAKYALISDLTRPGPARPDPARPNAFQTLISPKLIEVES